MVVWPSAALRSAAEHAAGQRVRAGVRPEIVCLCGSTRFHDAFRHAEYRLEQAGIVALSVGFDPAAAVHGGTVAVTPEVKARIDELHRSKIDLADRVLVLNVGGYVGESTAAEIAYAARCGKPIDFLEPPNAATPPPAATSAGGSHVAPLTGGQPNLYRGLGVPHPSRDAARSRRLTGGTLGTATPAAPAPPSLGDTETTDSGAAR